MGSAASRAGAGGGAGAPAGAALQDADVQREWRCATTRGLPLVLRLGAEALTLTDEGTGRQIYQAVRGRPRPCARRRAPL